MPTKEYTYYFDGVVPETIKVSLREHGSDRVNTYYYYDGFANLVQLKSSGTQSIKSNFSLFSSKSFYTILKLG